MGNVISKSVVSSVPQMDVPIEWERGILLGANVQNPRNSLYKGVVILFHQTDYSVIGLQLNRLLPNVSLNRLIVSLGFEHDMSLENDSVYYGGGFGANRMHFVHSLDWVGSSTVVINNCVGITSDLSIVTALCGRQGPQMYRACAGSWRWDRESLYDQIFNFDPNAEKEEYLWELAEVNKSLVFDQGGLDQWVAVMESSAQQQCQLWLN